MTAISARSKRRRCTRLQVEALEDRCVPSVNVFARDSTLFVIGDEGDNQVSIVIKDHVVNISADGTARGKFAEPGNLLVDLHGGHDAMTFDAEEALGAGPITDTDGDG